MLLGWEYRLVGAPEPIGPDAGAGADAAGLVGGADAGVFEELAQTLRQTEEWAYVDREVDIRLSRS